MKFFKLQEVNLNTIAELAKEGRIDTSQLITMKTLKVKIPTFKCHGLLENSADNVSFRRGLE